MIRKLHIAALILLWFLASARSCDNSQRMDEEHERLKISAETDSLRSFFCADTLSASALHAYDESARLKFNDLFDYLAVLSDSSVAEPFKAKAEGMIRGLFVSDITFQHLKILPAGIIKPDSIMVVQSLQRAGDSVYKGRLGYWWHTISDDKPGNSGGVSATGSVDFFVIRHRKNFGSDTLKIWELFLGDLP